MIYVLGATGYTGLKTFATFIEKAQDLGLREDEIYGISRDLQKAITSYPQYNWMSWLDLPLRLKKGDYVFNCAGPFRDLDRAYLQSLWRQEIQYIDVNGEADFSEWVFDCGKRSSFPSKIIPSCSFESACADFMAQSFSHGTPENPLIGLYSFYDLKEVRPSLGTTKTMKRASSIFFPLYEDSNLLHEKPLSRHGSIDGIESKMNNYAFFSPYPESYFFAKNYGVKNCASFQLCPEDQFQVLKMFQDSMADSSTKRERRQREVGGSFSLYLQAEYEDASTKCFHLKGVDPYGITVSLLINAYRHLSTHPETWEGVRSPAKALPKEVWARVIKECDLSIAEATLSYLPKN